MEKDLNRIKKSTVRYWFQDGWSDIVVGSLLSIIGVIYLIQGVLEPGSIFSGLSGLAVLIVVAAGIPIARKIIRNLKENITYPRSGYITYKKSSSYQRILSGFLGLSIAVIVSVLVYVSQTISILWIPFLLSLALAGFLIVIEFRTGLARYQLIATLVVLIGLALSLSEFSVTTSTGIVISSTGLLLVLFGIIVFIRYIRITATDEEEQDGG